MSIDESFYYYHLNIFGKNWLNHGKRLFDSRKEAIRCLDKQHLLSYRFWGSLKDRRIRGLLRGGWKLLRVDSRVCKGMRRWFLDRDFEENIKLTEPLESF